MDKYNIDRTRDGIFGVAAAVIVIIIIVFLVGTLKKTQCEAQASGMGLKSDWGPLQGCIVTLPSGDRILIDNYRKF